MMKSDGNDSFNLFWWGKRVPGSLNILIKSDGKVTELTELIIGWTSGPRLLAA